MSYNPGQGTVQYVCRFDSYEAAEEALAAELDMPELTPGTSMGGLVVPALIDKWALPVGAGGTFNRAKNALEFIVPAGFDL